MKKIFKKTIDWVENRIKKGILNSTSIDTLEQGISILEKEFSDYQNAKLKSYQVDKKMKKSYRSFVEKYKQRHKGIKAYKIDDLKPKLRKEVKQKILNSLLLIKNNQDTMLPTLISRLTNFVTIDSEDIRGLIPSGQTFEDYLIDKDKFKSLDKHARFVISDQTNKMREALDSTIRENLGAIAVIWKTQDDDRVVGNPRGKYKHGTPQHNNHYKREGKCFILKSGEAFQKGLIKGDFYDDLEDGGVGVAIGCRCYLDSIYYLEDMPKENLTKKGLEWLKKNL